MVHILVVVSKNMLWNEFHTRGIEKMKAECEDALFTIVHTDIEQSCTRIQNASSLKGST